MVRGTRAHVCVCGMCVGCHWHRPLAHHMGGRALDTLMGLDAGPPGVATVLCDAGPPGVAPVVCV